MAIRVVDGGGNGFRRADVDGVKAVAFRRTPGALHSVQEVVDFACDGLAADSEGVAFALAGVIRDRDLVVNSPNCHFLDGVKLASEVAAAARRKAPNAKVAIFNDMEAAVTGMAALFPKAGYFLGITWSSGIGLRVWSDGRLLSVAEGGHMMLDPSPFAPLCGCGRRGHVEAICGGDSIRRRVQAEAAARGVKLDPDQEAAAQLIAAWRDKQEWALDLQRLIARGMGIFLANIQTLLNLPLIVWKGTFALNALGDLEPLIRKEMKSVLIDPTWADKGHLAFRISPGADANSDIVKATGERFTPGKDANVDSLIGAAHCLRLPG